jgi:UDP-N-acetyl-2-amino-2-deoxyglucuronate dehydrogenase
MADFGVVGVAGFVAPRHLRAISETGHRVVAALDPRDSVGVLDQYFPDAHFFVEFERFDRHVDKLRRKGTPLDYLSVCSPNYLHDSHIRFGLRSGTDVICEKPLVLQPWNLDALEDLERETGRRVYNILQLRLHPVVQELRERIRQRVADDPRAHFDVDLGYVTARGRWYQVSWKGDPAKSGGIASNLGVHFFDMLLWVFGPLRSSVLHLSTPGSMAGVLELQHATGRWFLSLDLQMVPAEARARGQRTWRCIRIDDREMEFSEGFTDLHTAAYREILAGRGHGPADARPAIELVHDIREAPVTPSAEGRHPLAEAVGARMR